MFVYLVRHGHAVEGAVDSARPLSPHGRHEVQSVAGCLAARAALAVPLPIRQVWHSGKLRAAQTAEILAAKLAPQSQIEQQPGLTPNDHPHLMADKLNTTRDSAQAVILVGHLPHLPRLAGLLLYGQPDAACVRFRSASVAAIYWDQPDGWCLDWLLPAYLTIT